MSGNYKNYIFDLYGTLIDSDGDEKSDENWKVWLDFLDKKGILHPSAQAFREEFFSRDKSLREEFTLKYGYKFPEIDVIDVYRELFSKYGNGVLDDDLLNELSWEFRKATTSYIKLYDGVLEYLNKLSSEGKKIFILSNAQRSYTMPEIKMFELDKLTDAQFISSDHRCMKPETDFFDALFRSCNLKKSESVMVGDSIWSDINGAVAYGIDYIHLTGNNSADKFYLNNI